MVDKKVKTCLSIYLQHEYRRYILKIKLYISSY